MSDYAVVTGGARNIGAAIANRLTQDGFRVVVIDREKPKHDHLQEFIRVDLADAQAITRALHDFCKARSPTRLVNNAGIVMPATLEETDPQSVDQVMAVNVKAAIICAQTLLPSMRQAGIGRIVNISSRAALGKELRTVYAASKSALHGLTKTWALELGKDGITVNSVAPGPIRTSLFDEVNPPGSPRTEAIINAVPVGTLGSPADVADATSFFISDRAKFVTGQVLYVCGGMTVGSA
jgi:NAD(P)-dependent dehydrogenase (short-subunit alcohol dehydrogenase family)